jgi:hypothetical protein
LHGTFADTEFPVCKPAGLCLGQRQEWGAISECKVEDTMTDTLYKYRSMAMPEAKEHTLDIIDNSRLYCPPPTSLNDPFECQAAISFDAPTDIKNERAKQRLMKEEPWLLDADARKMAPEKWREVERNGTARLREWLLNDFGVISFSMRNDDLLMWSHYAGRHNGICVEFHCTHGSHLDFFGQVQQVRYSEQLPSVNFYTTPSPQNAVDLILTKAKDWSYEQEWRMVVPDAKRSSNYVELPPGIISAIYLGCQISSENKAAISDRIVSKASCKHIHVWQAMRHAHAYCLTFHPIIGPTVDKLASMG